MKNMELLDFYDKIYSKGKERYFTFDTMDVTDEVVKAIDYSGLSVLEVGCGTGATAFAISKKGAKSVLAFDYSKNAIKEAQKKYKRYNLKYEVNKIDSIHGEYDCIIMQEVIEHTDNPSETISFLSTHLSKDGHLIITCPSFLNIRGYIWMTLQLLFDVPMSLTDKYFISPFDMERWAHDCGLSLTWQTFRHEQAFGEKMIIDMKKRLTNALKDAKLDNSKVDDLLQWIHKASEYETKTVSNGAKGLYHFIKNM